MIVMRAGYQPLRVPSFEDLGNSRVLGKIRARRGGLASLPPGGGAGGLTTTNPWASTRQLVFCERLAVFEFESKSLDDRPSPMAMSGRFESSPSKLESRAYVSQSACAPRYPNSTGWPIGRVRPSNASPSPIGRSSREPIELRSDRAESRSNQSLLSIVIKFRNQNLHPWVWPLE